MGINCLTGFFKFYRTMLMTWHLFFYIYDFIGGECTIITGSWVYEV